MNGWSRGSLLLIGLAFLTPRLAHAQDAAEVTCKDGTKSHGGKGACSGHGGVDKSASKAAAQPAEKATSSSKSTSTSTSASASSAAAPAGAAPAEVTCKDGTTSHAGKGACSGHGGVNKTAASAGGAAASTGGSQPKKATRSPTSWDGASTSSTAPAASAAAPASAPAGQVICKDGTTSKGGKGACSGHHGVDTSATESPHGGTSASAATSMPAPGAGGSGAPPAASAPARTAAPAAAAAAPAPAAPSSNASASGQKAPTAKCKDGSLSYAQHHSGACSDHGGVAQWLDGTQK
jgi:hypothetical protein